MNSRSTFSPSTCTTAQGYTPASWCERIAGVVGRCEFRMALHPLETALCVATATVSQQVPAVTSFKQAHVCMAIEPEGEDDRRDHTLERALRIPSVNTTGGVVVAPGTGEGTWEGLDPHR